MEIKPMTLSSVGLGNGHISVKEDRMQVCYKSINDTGRFVEEEMKIIMERYTDFYNELEGSVKGEFGKEKIVLEEEIATTFSKLRLLSDEMKDYTHKIFGINYEADILAGGDGK